MGSIICGTDDSASARAAARVARALSAGLDLRLVFVRVLEAPASHVDAASDRLAHLCAGAVENDGGAEWVVAVGHPADQLVAAATKAKASLIVVGSHGPRSSSLGSISAEVSRRAPCPVVVVPPAADHGFSNIAGAVARLSGITDFTPDTAHRSRSG